MNSHPSFHTGTRRCTHVHTHIYSACFQAYYMNHPHNNRVVVGRGGVHSPQCHHPLTEKTSCRAQFARVSLLFSPTFIFLAERGIPIVKFAIRTAVPGIHPLEIAMSPQRRSPLTPRPGPALLVTLFTGPHDTRVQTHRSRGSSVTGDEPSSRCHHKKKAAQTTVT